VIAFFDVVLSQRACRRFTDEPVTEEALELCLRAATHAPSAENSQPWEFIVVRDAGLRGRIAELMQDTWCAGARAWSQDRLTPALLADVDAGFEGGLASAPVVVIVCGNIERALESTLGPSIYPATQNLLLAAAEQGLGSAMTTWPCSAGMGSRPYSACRTTSTRWPSYPLGTQPDRSVRRVDSPSGSVPTGTAGALPGNPAWLCHPAPERDHHDHQGGCGHREAHWKLCTVNGGSLPSYV
jgi:hypothetical protein